MNSIYFLFSQVLCLVLKIGAILCYFLCWLHSVSPFWSNFRPITSLYTYIPPVLPQDPPSVWHLMVLRAQYASGGGWGGGFWSEANNQMWVHAFVNLTGSNKCILIWWIDWIFKFFVFDVFRISPMVIMCILTKIKGYRKII